MHSELTSCSNGHNINRSLSLYWDFVDSPVWFKLVQVYTISHSLLPMSFSISCSPVLSPSDPSLQCCDSTFPKCNLLKSMISPCSENQKKKWFSLFSWNTSLLCVVKLLTRDLQKKTNNGIISCEGGDGTVSLLRLNMCFLIILILIVWENFQLFLCVLIAFLFIHVYIYILWFVYIYICIDLSIHCICISRCFCIKLFKREFNPKCCISIVFTNQYAD